MRPPSPEIYCGPIEEGPPPLHMCNAATYRNCNAIALQGDSIRPAQGLGGSKQTNRALCKKSQGHIRFNLTVSTAGCGFPVFAVT